jgi:hypothetical protein
MNQWIAFWNIFVKDLKTYYLKPPNISWGLIFPLAWTYGADLLHGAVRGKHTLPYLLDLAVLAVFCIGLFAVSLYNIQRRWIA